MSRVLEAILESWPTDLWIQSTIVLAVSGGPDSVALACALDQILLEQPAREHSRLVIAHLNHGLRGAESDKDEAFVRELAQRRNLQVFVERLQGQSQGSSEAHWRAARIRFFQRVAADVQASWIATGATADDSVETMLHNLLRGSGPAGLAGIRKQRELASGLKLIHPLLGLWKSELLEYLSQIGQSFRTDQSNAQNLYMRNRIRNECLPYLERFIDSDQLKERLLKTSELIRQEHDVIEQLALRWLDSQSVCWEDDQVQIDCKELCDLAWPVLQSALVALWHRMGWPLQQLSFRHWDQVRSWIDSSRGSNHPTRMQLPGPIELRIARKVLYIRSGM